MTTRLKKNANGYNYKYTDLAEINKAMEQMGLTYYQFIEPNDNGKDYMMTVIVDSDGKESAPRRGLPLVEATLQGKTNPAQEQGSGATYCRRYSLEMAMGFACEDNDAIEYDNATKIQPKAKSKEYQKLKKEIQEYADSHGMSMSEIGKDYKLSASSSEADLKACLEDLKNE